MHVRCVTSEGQRYEQRHRQTERKSKPVENSGRRKSGRVRNVCGDARTVDTIDVKIGLYVFYIYFKSMSRFSVLNVVYFPVGQSI